MANLRIMGRCTEAPTEIVVGIGQCKSETGIAFGVFYYPNEDFMLSASLFYSDNKVIGDISATWKLGRKTVTEKVRDVKIVEKNIKRELNFLI